MLSNRPIRVRKPAMVGFRGLWPLLGLARSRFSGSGLKEPPLWHVPKRIPGEATQAMSAKNFTCIFPSAGNVHLVKDVGMIADTLARDHGWDGRLVCLDRGQELSYLHDPVDRLKVDFIPDDPGYRMFRDPPRSLEPYLRSHARSIDVLQLLHNTRETRRIAKSFRRLNPKGKIFIKLDADMEWLTGEIERSRKSPIHWIKEHLLADLFLGRVPDLLTAETGVAVQAVGRLYPRSREKISVLPNGIDERWLCANGFAEIHRDRKEDLVLVVGRIGHHQKNHEMLLGALRLCSPGNWKIAFIGPVEDGFQAAIEEFFVERPDLRDRVSFVGEVVDRRELFVWYERAKVFCLTSRWESWCFALLDALRFGCHIVSTPVQSLPAITEGGRFAEVIETVEELSNRLQSVFEGRTEPLANFAAGMGYAKGFSWSSICETLLDRIDAVSR